MDAIPTPDCNHVVKETIFSQLVAWAQARLSHLSEYASSSATHWCSGALALKGKKRIEKLAPPSAFALAIACVDDRDYLKKILQRNEIFSNFKPPKMLVRVYSILICVYFFLQFTTFFNGFLILWVNCKNFFASFMQDSNSTTTATAETTNKIIIKLIFCAYHLLIFISLVANLQVKHVILAISTEFLLK